MGNGLVGQTAGSRRFLWLGILATMLAPLTVQASSTTVAPVIGASPDASVPAVERVALSLTPEEEGPGAIRAIVVGVDEYPNATNLAGPVNDANAIAKALADLGAEVVTLINGDADRQAIGRAYENLRGAVAPGDTVVLAFAGHGTAMPDRDGEGAFLFGSYGDQAERKAVLLNSVIATWLEELDWLGAQTVFVGDYDNAGYLIDRHAENLVTATLITAAASGDTIAELEIGGATHGALSFAFAAALSGDADFDRNDVISDRELLAYLPLAVEQLTDGSQEVAISNDDEEVVNLFTPQLPAERGTR